MSVTSALIGATVSSLVTSQRNLALLSAGSARNVCTFLDSRPDVSNVWSTFLSFLYHTMLASGLPPRDTHSSFTS